MEGIPGFISHGMVLLIGIGVGYLFAIFVVWGDL